MIRSEQLNELRERREAFDFLVVGGGATGLSVALDAASRGFSVALIERDDFASATSSRSTKLVHGGVRYLAQGDIPLVREALRERGLLQRNAAHLVNPLEFVIPSYGRWHQFYYGVGLKFYDMLAGKRSLGRSRFRNRSAVLQRLSTAEPEGLAGGVSYYDAQFDDARLAVGLARTARQQGAVVLNYMQAKQLRLENGKVAGVVAEDVETSETFELKARVTINATGVWSDFLRREENADEKPIIRASRGSHLVLPKRFLPGTRALMVPKTSDGRVLFAIPWQGVVVVGTTDVATGELAADPHPTEEEITFILEQAGQYLAEKPTRADILSIFAGLRPLVHPKGADDDGKTSKLSRNHSILVSPGGLVTIAGGKWTTCRNMAEETVDRALRVGGLPPKPVRTRDLPLAGAPGTGEETLGGFDIYGLYGTEAAKIQALEDSDPSLATPLVNDHPYTGAMVVYAAREEGARTVEDVLARRLRLLLRDAEAAWKATPTAARLLAHERGLDDRWAADEADRFRAVIARYLPGDP